ncbi:Histone-fold [Cynara cardunculus var. scolymus]|uniref:Histone H2A n=1 Tax=Cynara cardunculus var. scolymus TaxID=59895 RepID=A0A103YD19_CYNCS|nr:Histone-fold [Cynara cardunculus var. scolymus]
MAGRGQTLGSGEANKATSRSSKAGLQFPLGRIARFLKATSMLNVSVLELQSTSSPKSLSWLEMQQEITRTLEFVPRHIQLVVRNDKELSKLIGDVPIANGNVMPNIHNLWLPKKLHLVLDHSIWVSRNSICPSEGCVIQNLSGLGSFGLTSKVSWGLFWWSLSFFRCLSRLILLGVVLLLEDSVRFVIMLCHLLFLTMLVSDGIFVEGVVYHLHFWKHLAQPVSEVLDFFSLTVDGIGASCSRSLKL